MVLLQLQQLILLFSVHQAGGVSADPYNIADNNGKCSDTVSPTVRPQGCYDVSLPGGTVLVGEIQIYFCTW